jgi:hypothetical protein
MHVSAEIFYFLTIVMLRQVWDVNIIETAEKDYYDQGTDEFVDALNKNITVGIAKLF